MNVLLLQDVDSLGLAGDIVKVKNGFGRNYLIPQKFAVVATKNILKQADSIRRAGELRRAREKDDMLAVSNQLSGRVFVFEKRAGDRDKLYGSVTASEIAQAIEDKTGIIIDKRKIVLSEPIRTLGEFSITIKLMVEVAAELHVVVIREGETYTPPPPSPDEEEVTPLEKEESPVENNIEFAVA
ncbi:MAG: 50S ribosomal protein L9 [Anaerolineaceae bacterium 4572_78]|nr:MAG: 50S ribosomal protein L9 [Anaerolineaceae bacterium 4572_78]